MCPGFALESLIVIALQMVVFQGAVADRGTDSQPVTEGTPVAVAAGASMDMDRVPSPTASDQEPLTGAGKRTP